MIGGLQRCIGPAPDPAAREHQPAADDPNNVGSLLCAASGNFRVAQAVVASSSQDVRASHSAGNAAFVTRNSRCAREPARLWTVGVRSGRGEIEHFGRPDPLRRKMLFCCQRYAVMRSFPRLRRGERANSRASRSRRCDMGLQGSINLLAVGLSFGFVILVVLGTF